MSTSSFIQKAGESIKALGIVFGDIGTSPIYTLTIIFAFVPITAENILGVLSLILWMLILLITIQYTWLAMSLSLDGQGGTLVLGRIVRPLLSSSRWIFFITILSYMGSSLLIGDGVITPAISIMSAVEGLRLVPGLSQYISLQLIIFLACAIAFLLFLFQRHGTEKVSAAFGPIMFIWFLVLGTFGLIYVFKDPSILRAFNPYHLIMFFQRYPWIGFLVLSRAILSVTGGEALYADMGHLGRLPIIRAWIFACGLLCLSYLGQGVFLLNNPHVSHIFYQMVYSILRFWYVPFLLLSILATVIASQAIISGIYSVIFQGITTEILPKFRIDYTSRKFKSQIYIPFVNWSLFVLVIFAILHFKSVEMLARLYGLNTICTMTISGIIMSMIFYLRREYIKMVIASFITLIEFIVLLSSSSKIAYGGYWTIIIALIPFTVIMIYTLGKKKLQRSLRPISLGRFVSQYTDARQTSVRLKGTAVFFAKKTSFIPSYISSIMFTDGIVYEDNIIVSVVVLNRPFGVNIEFVNNVAKGLHLFEIRTGYMEIINIEKIINNVGIDPKVLFYGMEDIIPKQFIWKVYAIIKKMTPSFVQFYKLPADKLHGVLQRVEM